MTRRKSVIFGILMLFKIFFPVNLSQCCHGHILPDLQVIKFAISIPRSASVELTFSNNLNLRLLLSCVHLCTYVCMYVCMDIYAFRSSYFPARVARLLFIFIAFHLISLPAKKSSPDTFFIYMYVCSWWIINLIGFLAAASSYLLSSWRDVCKWSTKSIKDCQPPIILISPA